MNPKAASLVAFAVCVGCVIWLGLNKTLFANGPVTLIIQVAALLLMIWARLTFRVRSFHPGANPTAGGIVTSGPYRFVRHPIDAAIFYFLVGSVIAHPSASTVAAVVIADLGLYIRMRSEETLLLDRYPEYQSYAVRTRRVLPGVW